MLQLRGVNDSRWLDAVYYHHDAAPGPLRPREVGQQMARLIQRADELNPAWFEGVGTLGLTAGASAPELLVEQVIARLRALGALSVRKMAGVEETINFPLPLGLGDKSMAAHAAASAGASGSSVSSAS